MEMDMQTENIQYMETNTDVQMNMEVDSQAEESDQSIIKNYLKNVTNNLKIILLIL